MQEPWRHTLEVSNNGVISKRVAPVFFIFFSISFNFILECNREICRNIDFLDAPGFPVKSDIKLLCSEPRYPPQDTIRGSTAFGFS